MSVAPPPLGSKLEDLIDFESTIRDYKVTIQFGKEPLDTGSCGLVWPATADISGSVTKGKVVVKVLYIPKDEGNQTLLKTRFLREVFVWRDLNHPNIGTFYGLAYPDDHDSETNKLPQLESSSENPTSSLLRIPGLVSVFIEFPILQYVMENPNHRNDCVLGIARGLNYLNTKGVIHGDLRPDNLRVDKDGVVKIIDFGFSHIFTVSGFTTGRYRNLPWRFIAPEILFYDGDTVKPTYSGDVYSFSMCMLQILSYRAGKQPLNDTSSLPFNHITSNAEITWMRCIGEGQRPQQDHYPDSITNEKWCLMVECWGSNPDDRPPISRVCEELLKFK